MLYRKIEREINDWIRKDDRALLLYGVRQAGKTFIIRECLEKAGCDYVEFNLIEEPEVIRILQESPSTEDLILRLSLYSSRPIRPGVTFLFFDEVQRYKELVTRIKFLVEDHRFRYILSGSLLGVELVNLESAPVGYLTTREMFPLDFEEFLQISNITDDVMTHLKKSFENRSPVFETVHQKVMSLFLQYLVVGGMPDAVVSFAENHNLNNVTKIKLIRY